MLMGGGWNRKKSRHNRSLTERLNDAHKQLTEQHQEKTIEQKQELSNLSEVINKTENEIRKFHDKKLERWKNREYW